jgi:hypothetical protein
MKSNTTINWDAIFGSRAHEDVYASVREEDWELLAYRSGELQLYKLAKVSDRVHYKPEKRSELVNKLIALKKKWRLKNIQALNRSNLFLNRLPNS